MVKKTAKRGRLALIIYIALWAGWLASCSLDYSPALPDELSDGIPDTIVFGFSHTVVQNGSVRFVLKADRAETWGKKNQIVMRGVSFTEYSSADTSIVASGKADEAVFYTKTESADLKGNVFFSAPGDQISVRSGNLRWDGEARTLASQLDTVTVLSSKQSSISGAGFAADARRRSFAFQETVAGRFIPEQEGSQ